jgi:hypothetical protein
MHKESIWKILSSQIYLYTFLGMFLVKVEACWWIDQPGKEFCSISNGLANVCNRGLRGEEGRNLNLHLKKLTVYTSDSLRLVTVFTKALPWTLFWASRIIPTSAHHISTIRFEIVLSSTFGVPSGMFPCGFPTVRFYTVPIFPMHTVCLPITIRKLKESHTLLNYYVYCSVGYLTSSYQLQFILWHVGRF